MTKSEPNKVESRHHSLSNSLPGGVGHSMPHPGSGRSLQQEPPAHQATKVKRKKAGRHKSAQLPAHEVVHRMEHGLLRLLNEASDPAYRIE